MPWDHARCRRLRHRTGITLLELLVVIVLMLVLAALLLPMMTMTRVPGWKASCGNNQKQIILAMLVYANDNNGVWPTRGTSLTGAFENDAATTPSNAQSTTFGSFEFLAAVTGEGLRPKVFACPAMPEVRPSTDAAAHLDQSTATTSRWAAAASGISGDQRRPNYCYDWSVPANAVPARVVLADRALGTLAHRGSVEAGFADGHVGSLKLSPGAETTADLVNPALQTASQDGTCYVVINHDADPDPSDAGTAAAAISADSIYDAIGDRTALPPLIGRGSATRAWVH